MLKEIVFIGAGSALGGISRYAIGKWASNSILTSFPFSTFTINIIGSFLIGIFLGLHGKQTISTGTMLFLTTGFCGGFTTFSTFSYENLNLIKQGNIEIAILYIALSLIIGLGAVYIGYKVIGY